MNELRPLNSKSSPAVQPLTANKSAVPKDGPTSSNTTATAHTSAKPSIQPPTTNSSQLQTVTQLLKNTAEITVNVASTQQLDNKAQQLLAKVNPTLNQQILQAKSHLTQATPSNSLLHVVKLVQIGSPHTLLTTITPTAFKTGDQLQLQLNQQQQIVIKPTVASVRPAIAEGLKTALPNQQNISQLLNSIHSLQKLPSNLQNILVNNSTASQLNTLSHFIKNQYSLSSANQVKTALTNSGPLTEQKIQNQQSLHGDLRATLAALLKTLPNEARQKTTEYNPQKTIELAVTHLLTAITSTPTAKQSSNESIQQALGGLLQLLGIKSTQTNGQEAKKIQHAIAQKISQLATGAQEKIQLGQLRSLETGNSGDSNATKLVAFNTEIPLRFGDQVLPLQLSIKEMTEKKQENNEEENTQKENKKTTRRWHVFLSFDLPGNTPEHTHQLHTQLIIVDDVVSATLWSDSLPLCQKAKQQLHTLRNNLIAKGLQVEDLLCINGKPPQQTASLDYNLIDITT